MIVIFAPSRAKASRAARRRGLRPGRDCILVWDEESIKLTCLQDYIHEPIEINPTAIHQQTRDRMAAYLDLISSDPSQGFGWRNWMAKNLDGWVDPDTPRELE